MQLYSYFRSSAAFRARIALNLKGLSYETLSVHLQKEGGLNRKPEFRAINPHMRLPVLRLDSGDVLCSRLPSSNISTRPTRSRRFCRATRLQGLKCARSRR